jgi:hypothetical protein
LWKSKVRRFSVRILELSLPLFGAPKYRLSAEKSGSSGSVLDLETTCSCFVTDGREENTLHALL